MNNRHLSRSNHLKFVSSGWLLCLVLALAIAGCKVPGMHRPEIEQGNIITQKMVDQLEPNMTKVQVEFVLGKPVHQNLFDINRWDYIWTVERRDGQRARKLLSLTFEEELLVSMTGDFEFPGANPELEDSSQAENSASNHSLASQYLDL